MTAMQRSSVVLVVGHEGGAGDAWALEREGGTASLLRQLGANVRTRTFWQTEETPQVDEPPASMETSTKREREKELRAIVLELGERPDFAAGAMRHLRKALPASVLGTAPVLVVIGERQITRLDPSIGFDDFLVLPCRAEELYARIRAVEWRRSEFASEERSKVGGVVVDRAAHEATVDGRGVQLTAKEFALLSFLAANRGRVFTRETLLARVWGSRYEGGARTVDIHVRRLRAKLGESLPLETLRGAGYKMRAPDSIGDDVEPSDQVRLVQRKSS